MIGKRNGYLTVLSIRKGKFGGYVYKVRCDCGKVFDSTASDFIARRSCGEGCPVKEGTLCWHCAHAVPNPKKGLGCSWSRELVPVKGWDAEYRNIRGSKLPSYLVKACPMYKENEHKK